MEDIQITLNLGEGGSQLVSSQCNEVDFHFFQLIGLCQVMKSHQCRNAIGVIFEHDGFDVYGQAMAVRTVKFEPFPLADFVLGTRAEGEPAGHY